MSGLPPSYMRRSGRFVRQALVVLVVLLALVISTFHRSGKVDNDLIAAYEAREYQDWSQVARFSQRYLRVEMSPEKRWEAWKLMIEASEKLGENAWVVDYLEAALLEYGEGSVYYSHILEKLGSLYEKNRQWDKASAIWELRLASQELTPNTAAEIYRNRGRVFFIGHNFDQAREMFQLCENNATASDLQSECVYYQADTYVAQGDVDAALASLNKVFDIPGAPGSIRGMAHLLRGDIYEQLNNNREAIIEFEAALPLHPNASVVQTRIDALK